MKSRPHETTPRRRAAGHATAFALVATIAVLTGCSDNLFRSNATPRDTRGDRMMGSILGAPDAGAGAGAASISQRDPDPPAGLVTVPIGGAPLTFWPYTGGSFDGTPSDPINLIFTGDADPARIRAALMALDGDRTAFGFPPVSPFNERWADAIGDVQTTFADEPGWLGSVIQLRLGQYEPLRVHLRLFGPGATEAEGSDASWTLGGAHFEALIPGTADHQVLSWTIARQVVMVDLIRSGLLTAVPPAMTNPISASPSFRDIPAVIYNGLPPELKGLIGGPQGPVSEAVPLESDGRAAILAMSGTPAAAAGSWTQRFSLAYGQVVPKPLCSDGPYDWVYVAGPVEFEKTATVDADGRYQANARVSGRLTVTPVDITQNPPVPVGASFDATVSDQQEGYLDAAGQAVFARSRRIAPQKGGAELLMTDLKVSSSGVKEYRLMTQCPTP